MSILARLRKLLSPNPSAAPSPTRSAHDYPEPPAPPAHTYAVVQWCHLCGRMHA